jgi:glutathione synthase/RimK-type ligase-like ATP-grasp enzyme
MKICVITDEKGAYSSKKFLEISKNRGEKMFFSSWKGLLFDGTKNEVFTKEKVPLKKFDAIILRSSSDSLTPSSLVVEYCQQNNIRLLNKKFYLRHPSINKLNQQLIFQANKIPCLKTIFGESVSFSFLKKTLGVPFIAKLTNGSLGKQVFKIDSANDFSRFKKERQLDRKPYLFQKFYKNDGDYRVFIVGKKIFGPMKRFAPPGEWKTNMRGSTHKRVSAPKSVTEIARDFHTKTGIEFAGLDILIDSAGKTRLIEINTMACFKVFDRYYPEVNIARQIMKIL